MGGPDGQPDAAADGPHAAAARSFAERVQELDLDEVVACYLFGSTALGEASGLSSDVDFLVVLEDDADRGSTEDRLRDVAYDVMLKFGPVVEVHVLTRSEFERQREDGHPFVRQALREGTAYA